MKFIKKSILYYKIFLQQYKKSKFTNEHAKREMSKLIKVNNKEKLTRTKKI